jgi:hypothetical protein
VGQVRRWKWWTAGFIVTLEARSDAVFFRRVFLFYILVNI